MVVQWDLTNKNEPYLYGGFLKWGYPYSWLVYNGKPENPKIDYLGVALF